MNFDDSIKRQELYSELVLLGCNAEGIQALKPTTHQLECIVSGLNKLNYICKMKEIYNDIK